MISTNGFVSFVNTNFSKYFTSTGDDQLGITTELNGSGTHLIIKVSGKFDYNLQKKFKESYELQEQNTTSDCQMLVSKYTIDLTNVNYLDSSALGMLLSLRTFSNHQDCVKIIGAQPSIRELLELSGFDRLFTID